MNRRNTLKLAAVAICLLAAPLPAAHASASNQATDKTLTVAINTDMRGLMPGSGPDTTSGTIRQHLYEGLVAWRSDGRVEPMLAEKIDVSEDGRVYTFTLRPDVRFHNGEPLTSAEVVWTWQRFLDPKGSWPGRTAFDGTNGTKITNVEAIDGNTVQFTLAQPSNVFLSAMARADLDSTGIAHPASVDDKGNWAQAIGTGPFKLADWRRKEYIDLEKFDQYQPRAEEPDGLTGRKQALVDKVRVRIVPDASAARAALRSGAIDIWADMPPEMYKELSQDKRVQLDAGQTASIYTLPFQVNDPVLADARVRQAISKAIDRDGLVQALTGGSSQASASLVPVTSRFYGEAQRTGGEYDLDGARALLAQSGYKGQPITIITNKQNALMSNTAIAVQAMLQAAGINAQIEVLEFATLYERYYSGRYQMAVWNVTPYLDPTFMFDRFIGDKSKQPDRPWDDAQARELLHALFSAADDAQRQDIINQLQALYEKQMPMVVWASRSQVTAMNPRVQGYAAWPGQKPRFWNVGLGN